MMSWRRMRMFGLGLFIVDAIYLLVQTALTLLHYLLYWQTRSSCLILVITIFHVPPAIGLLVVLYLALRSRNASLVGMFIRCYSIYILLLTMNTLFSMVAIASGYKTAEYYWIDDTPTLILIKDYLSAFVILFSIWTCRQLYQQLQPSSLQIANRHSMTNKKRIINRSIDASPTTTTAAAVVETNVGTTSNDATIDTLSKHNWYSRMNTNGFVAEPEVILRTPTSTQPPLTINCSSSTSSTSSTASLPTATHIECRKKKKHHHHHRHHLYSTTSPSVPVDNAPPLSPVQKIWPPRGP